VDHLSQGQLTAVTQVDHESEEVLIAFDPVSGDCVGMARYVRDPGDPKQAEFDIAVLDAWQRRGVGTVLSERVVRRATASGIHRLTAHMMVGDEPARRLLAHIAEAVTEQRDGGVLEIRARIREPQP
jgi:acetyltransferase